MTRQYFPLFIHYETTVARWGVQQLKMKKNTSKQKKVVIIIKGLGHNVVYTFATWTPHCAEEVNSRYIWTADSYEATYLVKMMGTSGWLGNRLIRIPMKNGAAQQIFMFPGFTPFYFIKSGLRFIASHIRCQGTVQPSSYFLRVRSHF